MEEKRYNGLDSLLSTIFMLCNICILGSVVIADKPDIEGYYQNLILVSFPILIEIYHFGVEINKKKEQNKYLPKPFLWIYKVCKGIVIACIVNAMCVYIIARENHVVKNHLQHNMYNGACVPSMIAVIVLIVFIYFIPSIIELPYREAKREVKLQDEDREDKNTETLYNNIRYEER